MDYEIAYHLHCGIKLDNGRVINMKRLDQQHTYWGLIEGYPCKAQNNQRVQEVIHQAKTLYPWLKEREPCLIPPVRRDYLRHPGDREHAKKRLRGEVEWLPQIQCIGLFESMPIEMSFDLSSLTIVWFQDEFALPISTSVLQAIKSIEWNKLAHDEEF
ncbi:MAG: hypothetical protein AB4063_08315 [Crocosphaera sp.]